MSEDRVYGLHAVLAALTASPQHVDAVWLDENRKDQRIHSIVRAAQAARVKLHKVPRAKLDQLAGIGQHQGVVARYRATPRQGEPELAGFLEQLPATPLLLVLDGVQDPHNLGACLRSAEAAGAHGVILPRDQSVSLTATVRRVACGAAEVVPIFQVPNLVRALKQMRERGIWLVGAAGDAKTAVFDADLRGPAALVLGGEERGLRRLTRENCDVLVHIPMLGEIESLNVSVAAGVCLYEAVRQRRS